MGFAANIMGQEKEIRGTQTKKEEIKLSTDNMTIYVENPPNLKKFPVTSEFIKS